MMLPRLFRAALAVACTFALQSAWADIYTWVDPSGTINISNIAPPEGVKVSKVVHESPPRPVPAPDPAADASRQAEVQFLAERVRQLEYQVESARYQPPMPMPMPPPMPVQYAAMGPAVPQYVYDAPQPAFNDCDPTWAQCGNWWGAPFYPTTVVVVRAPGFRRPPPFHGGHRAGMQTAMRSPGGFNRR